MTKSKVVSMSGSPVLHHGPEKPWAPPQGEENLEAIGVHIEKHVGPVTMVFHEIVSDTVHIDVHWVEPSKAFPFHTMVTSGMSDLPMKVPNEGLPSFLELMILLDPNWQVSDTAFKDERWYWPVRLLKTLARLPHKHDTWLGYGHSVPNGDPPKPYADNTKLCGAVLLPALGTGDGMWSLKLEGGKQIAFLGIMPVYEEEMNLKLRAGSDALLDKFSQAGLDDIVHSERRNVAKKRFFFF